MRRLVVTADDAGLDPGMTAGAIEAHRNGIVTAVSIVANGVAFEDAVERLRAVPSLEIGVHLALVEERPLTEMRFAQNYATFLPRLPFLSSAAIERELSAQIEKVLATGLTITHLNGHQHLHALPRITSIVRRLADRHGIHYIRRVDDHYGSGALSRRIAISVLNRFGRQARIRGNVDTIGVMEAGHLTSERIIPLLESVEDRTELVTHPGIGVRGYSHWRYDWEGEMRALCDPRVREAIVARGIELIGPSGMK